MTPTEDAIRFRAYALWEARGRVHGQHEDHWFEAREHLEREAAVAHAAPAAAHHPVMEAVEHGIDAATGLAVVAAHRIAALFGGGKEGGGS